LRFLANENFPAAAVTALAAAGHDVVWVRIAAPGAPDPDVLAWAGARATSSADLRQGYLQYFIEKGGIAVGGLTGKVAYND
jgi:Domain of unknown function (DUF5615)